MTESFSNIESMLTLTQFSSDRKYQFGYAESRRARGREILRPL